MKKIFAGFLSMLFAILFLAMANVSHAVGPVMVNLVPISGLSNAAAIADTNLFYVTQGATSASYRKATGLQLRRFLRDSTYTFTDTLQGVTTAVTGSVICTRSGDLVTCRIPAWTGTSDSAGKVIEHFPSAIRPTVAQLVSLAQITDTSTVFYGRKATIGTDGRFIMTNNGTALAASGTFTLTAGTAFSYTIK